MADVSHLARLSLALVLGFLCGAVPFAVYLGWLIAGTDVRLYGDGNPGATNAWRAGGWKAGLPVLLLDFLKGAMPVGWAHFTLELTAWELALVALTPVLGHAFSPFLRFRGGKAVAVTFGIWSGLTLWEAPTVLGLALILALVIRLKDAWAVMFGMAALLFYLLLRGASANMFALWLGNSLLLGWSHRRELLHGMLVRSSAGRTGTSGRSQG